MAIFNEMLGGGINAKDCTATAADILTGKTAAVGKEIVTGSMADLSNKTTIDYATDNVTPVIQGDQRFFNTNTDGVHRALIRYNGENGYLRGNTLFGLPAESKTVNPTASAQTVTCSDGKLLEKVTVNGVTNLTATNIKAGVNVGGVVGTFSDAISGYSTRYDVQVSTSNPIVLPDNWKMIFFYRSTGTAAYQHATTVIIRSLHIYSTEPGKNEATILTYNNDTLHIVGSTSSGTNYIRIVDDKYIYGAYYSGGTTNFDSSSRFRGFIFY